jgi:glycosyltransferase involved in cell wall biosynthesis
MMRVALCTDGVYPHAMGGMQRHSRLLAEHLAATGQVELMVVHPHAHGIFEHVPNIQEYPISPIDPARSYLPELWRYSGRVAKVLQDHRPDVVFAQGFSVWQHGERFSERLVVHPHGLEMFQGLSVKERLLGLPFRWAMRRVLRQARYCISLGGKLTAILRAQVSNSACEVVVVPNATELPPVLPWPQENGLTDLLFVGRFAFNKGLDVLMTVAHRLAAEGRSDVRFRLAGDGPLLGHYQAKGLPPNVELLGRVDDAALAACYGQCHALVLPTRFEGMPTVVLEAMAAARPVLVSHVGATAELVNMHNGYLLPPGDVQALYDAVMAFAQRPASVRQAMGRYGRARVMERFTWPVVAEQVLGLCTQVHAGQL